MGKRITTHSRSFDYFFVKPSGKSSESVHRAAKKLIGISRVREVSITEGDYGFVVKAEQAYDDGNLTSGEIVRAIGGGSSKRAICHCRYVKG